MSRCVFASLLVWFFTPLAWAEPPADPPNAAAEVEPEAATDPVEPVAADPEPPSEDTPSDGEPASEESPPDTDDPTTAPSPDALLRQRAEHVRALVDGTLDEQVDARALFVLDLNDPVWTDDAGVRFARILDRVRTAEPPAPPRRGRKPPPKADLATLTPDQALETALGEFFAQAPERRTALLEAHDARQKAAEVDSERRAADELAAQRHADHLRAYLTGTLDTQVDPSGLLRFDLLDDPATADDIKESVARADLDLQRRRYLALSPEEREGLAETHARRIAEAEAEAQRQAEAEAAAAAPPTEDAEEKQRELDEALAEKERAAQERKEASEVLTDAEAQAQRKAEARAAAEEAARRADTQAKRILAQERARLLGIQEEQANHEAALARRRVVRAEDHDRVLDWGLRVTTLAESPKFESEIAAEADPMYREIREDLDVLRARLSDDLTRLKNAGEDVPGVGEPLDVDLPTNLDRGDIPELRGEVARKEAELRSAEEETGWELAAQTRDDVVALNAARLRLLELASPRLRRAVTSFGAEGVDQAKREFKQISLELGYFALSLRRHRAQFFHELVNSTVQVIIALLKLAAVIVVFVWWRRRGTEILQRLEAALRARRPMTRGLRIAVSFVWYLRRVRRPLVVLAVIWGLMYVIEDIRGIPNLRLVWIAAQWILIGLASVLLIDAIAARETLYTASKRDNSTLRIHSLRVVGLNVIAVGMLLSLSAEMVGRGAIYSWVLSTCWLLSFPVAIYLVHRWKPIIFDLVGERLEQTAFTRWVTAQRSGLSSFPAAAAGAAYLLGKGSATWVMRQLSGLEVTRRLLAYLFRRELAKQAAATEADGRFKPVGKKIRAFFDPENVPDPLIDTIATKQLASVTELVRSSGRTLTAVIGERGAGKSVFVRRLAASVEDIQVHCVTCPEEGIDALLAELARIAGNPGASGDDLVRSVRELGRCVIVVDDVQRLVVPAVNGLRDLDAFTNFSRAVGGGISWVVTIGSAAWHFIRRARRERVSFEQVIELPRWSEEALGALIKAQCEKANIEPSFEGLVVPRQNEPLPDQGDRTEASYYRLLWDFSRGNPGVALHAFRESLFYDDDKVVVRLFKEPSPEEIESLTLSQLFILRTVVQLELAVPGEIQRATQLPSTDVEDAMRFCTSRGYVEPFQGGYRLAWPWYRTITTVLQRQHLLSSL